VGTTWPTNAAPAAAPRAAGYSDNDELRPAAEWRALRPSGAFYSTVLDLARWDAALYGDTILTATAREAMWAPVVLKDGSLSYYGFGWQLGRGKRKAVYHTGGMDVIFTGLAELYLSAPP
jgi:D-alanyl-D-alanine carboxypeptidase